MWRFLLLQIDAKTKQPVLYDIEDKINFAVFPGLQVGRAHAAACTRVHALPACCGTYSVGDQARRNQSNVAVALVGTRDARIPWRGTGPGWTRCGAWMDVVWGDELARLLLAGHCCTAFSKH